MMEVIRINELTQIQLSQLLSLVGVPQETIRLIKGLL